MADEDGVGAGVGDETDPPTGLVDVPHGELARHRADPVGGEELRRPGTHPSHEVGHPLAALEAVPQSDRRPLAQLAVRLGRPLGWSSVPFGVADLLEPVLDHLGAPEHVPHRRRGLAGPYERRHVELVERLVDQRLRQPVGLGVAELGQRWVHHRSAVLHPFRLSVPDQHQFHPAQATRRPAAPAGALRATAPAGQRRACPVACARCRCSHPATPVPSRRRHRRGDRRRAPGRAARCHRRRHRAPRPGRSRRRHQGGPAPGSRSDRARRAPARARRSAC